jgi:hypothetical protein
MYQCPPVRLNAPREESSYAERVQGLDDLGLCCSFLDHVRGRGASQDEQAQDLSLDYDMGVEFAEAIFGTAKERHFLYGNHDTRVFGLLDSSDGRMRSLGLECCGKITKWTSKNRIQTYPYDSRTGVLKLGHLHIIHGFHTGVSACAAHSRVYGNTLFGHVHSIESYQTPGLDQKEARAIGCLCKLDMPYINHKTAKLRWANGFAYGFLYEDQTYTLFQARKINGRFHVATGFGTF